MHGTAPFDAVASISPIRPASVLGAAHVRPGSRPLTLSHATPLPARAQSGFDAVDLSNSAHPEETPFCGVGDDFCGAQFDFSCAFPILDMDADDFSVPTSPNSPQALTPHEKVAVVPAKAAGEEVTGEEDASMEDASMEALDPVEEKRLRKLLSEKQQALRQCTIRTRKMPPAEKKRQRNRHASCVSRIKKKLILYNLQRDLKASREYARQLEVEVQGQRGTIRYFQQKNAHLIARLRQFVPDFVPGAAS